MSGPVPFDEAAEQALAGAAVWSQDAARAVMAAVDLGDFYAPWFARVVTACSTPPRDAALLAPGVLRL